jgi:hypothetical protein
MVRIRARQPFFFFRKNQNRAGRFPDDSFGIATIQLCSQPVVLTGGITNRPSDVAKRIRLFVNVNQRSALNLLAR